MLAPCNHCGGLADPKDFCPGHPQEYLVEATGKKHIFTGHIFQDHHKIGEVWVFGGKRVALYCDGYEQ